LHLTLFFKCVDVLQRNILKIFVRNKKTEEDKTKSGGKCEQWFENVQTGSYRLNLERCEPKNFTGEVDAEERGENEGEGAKREESSISSKQCKAAYLNIRII
jgi:hypothetical protein